MDDAAVGAALIMAAAILLPGAFIFLLYDESGCGQWTEDELSDMAYQYVKENGGQMDNEKLRSIMSSRTGLDENYECIMDAVIENERLVKYGGSWRGEGTVETFDYATGGNGSEYEDDW